MCFRPLCTLLFAAVFAGHLSGQADSTLLLHDAALTGWRVLIDNRGTVAATDQDHFVWEDSVLHVLPHAPAGSEQDFAALITEKPYANFRLHVAYRWGEKKFAPRNAAVRDAGILFHVFDTTAFWPGALECQIQEGDTGDIWLIDSRATSTVGEESRDFSPDGRAEQRTGERYTRFSRSASWERPGWNEIVLEVTGDAARFYVNGHLVNAFLQAERPTDDRAGWMPLTEGYIALQAEGAEVFYRNVWLEEL